MPIKIEDNKKATIFWNSFIQNMMMILWMLTCRCFISNWWFLLSQNFMRFQICCFINTDEQILDSSIECNIFLWSPLIDPMWNFLMIKRENTKELGFLISLSKLSYYISYGASLLLSMSPTKYHIMRCP